MRPSLQSRAGTRQREGLPAFQKRRLRPLLQEEWVEKAASRYRPLVPMAARAAGPCLHRGEGGRAVPWLVLAWPDASGRGLRPGLRRRGEENGPGLRPGPALAPSLPPGVAFPCQLGLALPCCLCARSAPRSLPGEPGAELAATAPAPTLSPESTYRPGRHGEAGGNLLWQPLWCWGQTWLQGPRVPVPFRWGRGSPTPGAKGCRAWRPRPSFPPGSALRREESDARPALAPWWHPRKAALSLGVKVSVSSLSAAGTVGSDRARWGPGRGRRGRLALPRCGRAPLQRVTARNGKAGSRAVGLWPWRAWSQAACGVPPIADRRAALMRAPRGRPRGAPEELLWKKTSAAQCSASSPGGAGVPCWCGSRPLCSTWPPDAPAWLSSAQTVGLEGLRRDRSAHRSKRYHVSEREPESGK